MRLPHFARNDMMMSLSCFVCHYILIIRLPHFVRNDIFLYEIAAFHS